MNDIQLEIHQMLVTGTTPRKVMFVPQSMNYVVYLPKKLSWRFYDIDSVYRPEEAVKMHQYRHKSGESVYIGLSTAHDVIICTENAKELMGT